MTTHSQWLILQLIKLYSNTYLYMFKRGQHEIHLLHTYDFVFRDDIIIVVDTMRRFSGE